MPESKTIQIDEIVTSGKPAGRTREHGWNPSRQDDTASESTPGPEFADPFAGFHKALPLRARLTLGVTRWLMILRSKPWGKLVILAAVVLVLLLAIPLGLIALLALLIRKIIK